jgi:gliding motility-associated-like protein
MKRKFIARKITVLLLLMMSVNSFAQLGGAGGLGGLGGLLSGLGGLGGLGGGTSTDTAIVIDTASQLLFCGGSTVVSITYHTTTTFANGNVFKAQLVSAFGGLLGGATTPVVLTPASGGLGGLLGGGAGSGGASSKTYTGIVPAGTPTGIYNVQLISSNPEHTSAASSAFIIVDNPTVSISSVCKNDSIFLTATTGGTNPILSTLGGLLISSSGLGGLLVGSKIPLLWSTGDTSHTIYAGHSGSYSVTYTDTALSCNATKNISVVKKPIAVDCQMENVKLSSPANADSYIWTKNSITVSTSKSITIRNDVTESYQLVTQNPFSCVSINVTPSICADSNEIYVFVPTMFTPNGDGHNDQLFVRGDNIKELYFSIFDRWGEVVFNTEDPKKGWDGTFNGKEVDPSVLVWYLKTKSHLGEQKEEKGYVTLMR